MSTTNAPAPLMELTEISKLTPMSEYKIVKHALIKRYNRPESVGTWIGKSIQFGSLLSWIEYMSPEHVYNTLYYVILRLLVLC